MRRIKQKQLYKEFNLKYGRSPLRASFRPSKGQPLGWVRRALGQFVEPEQSAQDEMRYLRNQYRRSRLPSLSSKRKREIRKISRDFRKRLLKRK